MRANENPRILQLAFNRWYIVHPTVDSLAWTGNRWARHYEGVPIAGAQICNFNTEADALQYLEGPPIAHGIGSPYLFHGGL